MSMARRVSSKTGAIAVKLLREGIVESTHQVQAVVCDARGRLLMSAGDPESSSFIRSSLKPFQALAVVGSGTLERFGLDDRDLAIMCASHAGSVMHARQAFNILWKCDLDPSALQCPLPAGKRSALEHNCSGKHAGMLAMCSQCGWSVHDYMDRRHPVQQFILGKIAECLGMPAAELMTARDDCGVPTCYMPLHQMALLYARLASSDSLDMERVVRAMVHHPDLVAGEGGFDTVLMRLSQGELVSKSGAEGIQCISHVSQGQGLAIKVQDGARRAKYATAIHLLRQMSWITPAMAEDLSEQFSTLNESKRLEVSGELTIL